MSVDFSPDGRWLASADHLGVAELRDVPSQRLAARLPGHKALTRLRFAPAGQLLATGDTDGIVRVWRPGEVHPVAVLTNKFLLVALDFSPDGHTLAVGGWPFSDRPEERSNIVLWDMRTFQPSRAVEDNLRRVWSLAYDPRGRYLAAGFSDGTVRLWNASTLRYLHSWKAHSRFVPSLAFSVDGARLASGGADAAVALYDPTKPDEIETVLRGSVVCRSNSPPDDRKLAFCVPNGNASADSTAAMFWLARLRTATNRASAAHLQTLNRRRICVVVPDIKKLGPS